MSFPYSDLPVNGAERLRGEDINRHLENVRRYGALYDAADYESPAACGAALSQELKNILRQLEIKGGGQQ